MESAYNLDFSKNSCARLINNTVSSKTEELVEALEEFARFCDANNQEKVANYFMEVADLFKTVNYHNSFEVNAKNIIGAKFPVSPRVSSTVEIKPQIDMMR